MISYPQVYDANGKKLPLILWTNSLTEEGHVERYLSKDDYIIQIWTKGNDSVVKELIEKDFRVIFSNYDAWYLDCGYSSWVGEGNNWCSPYKGWQASPTSHFLSIFSSFSFQIVYDNSPREHYRNAGGERFREQQILGGEAAMWTEQVIRNSRNVTTTNSGGWCCSDAQAVASHLSTGRTTLE